MAFSFENRGPQPESLVISDSQNLVIRDKRYGASVLPQSKVEMWRQFSFSGCCEVDGSLFGASMKVHSGPLLITESVFLKDDALFILDKSDCRSEIRGCLQANRSVKTETSPHVRDSYVVFGADIYSRIVNLDHVFVYGNIYCQSAIVRDSVVMGAIYSKGVLDVSGAVVGMLSGKTVRLTGGIRLLLPVVVSEQPPEVTGDVRMVFLRNPLAAGGSGQVAGTINLCPEDLLGNSYARRTDIVRADSSVTPAFTLGPGLRLLNIDPCHQIVADHFDCLAGVYLGQVLHDPRGFDEREWERGMWDVLTRDDIKELDQTFSLYEVTVDALSGSCPA